MTGTPRALRLPDLVLYTVAMTLSVRWVAVTAAAGPVAPLLWLAAMLGFMVPLVLCTAELTGRYAGSGGVYAWTRAAFGPFAGFLCGWLYWTCNLPFFSGLLVIIVATAGRAAGGTVETALATTPGYVAVAILLAALVTLAHWRGLGTGKWLASLGAVGACALILFIIAAGLSIALRGGSATDFGTASYRLKPNADFALLWATMVFAFGGPEGMAFLKDDVRGGMGAILRALACVGALLVLVYSLATLGMLAILPAPEISRLAGLPDAFAASAGRLGAAWLAPALIGMLALTLLGNYASWFGLAARLPFVAGVDAVLPRAFARRDPRTSAPTAALLTQAVLVVVLVLLGAAGADVRAAYDFLVSMTVLSYTLPFLFLFAAYLRLTRADAGEAWIVPGGLRVRRAVGGIGLAVAASAVCCTLVPSGEALDAGLAALKLIVASSVLIGFGAASYAFARRGGAYA